MRVLVTGGTGKVGSAVVNELLRREVTTRVLTRRRPETGKLPGQVEWAVGDLLDPVAVEQAMRGVDRVFLLNAVIPEELTQALIVYNLARRADLQHITYLSVYMADRFRNVPHFASKAAVEIAMREFGGSCTILRPGYFFQNDAALMELITGPGIYPAPIGTAGIAAVDIRDIAEAAAISLTEVGHDGAAYDLVGPSDLTGPGNAGVWSRVLGKQIAYAGHDFDRFEETMRGRAPGWSAFDLRMMFQGYFDRGFRSTQTALTRFTTLLGHAPRSYEDFAKETAAGWNR